MVLETKSGLEGAVIGGGHSVAASRLDAQRSVAGWVSEQMGGLSYLFYIRDLVSLVVCLLLSQYPLSFTVSLQLTSSLALVTPIPVDMCFTVARDSAACAHSKSLCCLVQILMRPACSGPHCFADDLLSAAAFPSIFLLNSYLPGTLAEIQADSVLQQ